MLGRIDGESRVGQELIERRAPCRATALGRSGLRIVTATRAGPGLFQIVLPETGVWHFALLCGREGRPLSPSALAIGPEHAGKEVRLAIR